MIKKPSNWENVQAMNDRAKLPVGAYVCRIKKAAVQNYGYGNQLAVLFDIAEGEHAGFFERDFQSNQNADRKWKGVLRLRLPVDDNSENDEFAKRILKGFVTSVERSNAGYAWNWDEGSLTNKNVGVLFRNEEWEWQGKTGWAVRPFRAISADTVRNGDYTIPADKPLNTATTQVNSAKTLQEVEVDDLPF